MDKINKNNKDTSTNINNNKPILFYKKVNKLLIKPLNLITSDTGKTRHFTPASQEWFNSIYTYNTNYIKSLSVSDNNLMEILKSYFNSYVTNKLLKTDIKRILKDRWKSTKKVFVGKGELKHTSKKVIITLYVYNTEGFFLSSLYKKEKISLYYPNINLECSINEDSNKKNKIIITWNRKFDLNELLSTSFQSLLYISTITSVISKRNRLLILFDKFYNNLTDLVNMNILTEKDKLLIFNAKLNNLKFIYYINIKTFFDFSKKVFKNKFNKYLYLLNFNKIKFENTNYLNKLIGLIKNLYNKDIRLNIVNLKKMHLNSDIYTQIVSLKLKNRNSKLYKVLKSSLRKIKLPVVSKIGDKLNKSEKNEFIINNIRNNIINSMFINKNKDPLNNLLLDYFPSANNLHTTSIKRGYVKMYSVSLKHYLLKHLKHIKLKGIKVEAKGRLTRRLTASRSVFKMKWKGGLKNIDSSFRGLSTIMLRGVIKSNIQYSVLNSKNRTGAFGVKGWVSSK